MKILASIGAALAAAVFVGTPAQAAAPTHQILVNDFCVDRGYVVLCVEEHIVFHTVVLPTGGSIIVSNGRSDFTYTYPDGRVLSNTTDIHRQTNLARGELIEQHQFSLGDYQSFIPGEENCAFSSRVHFAGGVFQVNESTYICT